MKTKLCVVFPAAGAYGGLGCDCSKGTTKYSKYILIVSAVTGALTINESEVNLLMWRTKQAN